MAWHDSQQLDVYLPLLMKRLQQQRGAELAGKSHGGAGHPTALPIRPVRLRWTWVVGAASVGTLLVGGWIAYSTHALF